MRVRVLAATFGALLITVSGPALSQKQNGSMPQGKEEQPRKEQQHGKEQHSNKEQHPNKAGSSRETAQDQPRQPEALKAEMQQDHAPELPHDAQWSAVSEQGLGTVMDLPRAVFSVDDGHAYKDAGRRYKTPDGRAKVAIWTQANTRHETPAGYLGRIFDIPRNTLDYERKTPGFAVISGVSGGKVYYIRCNLARRGGTFHCFDLAYPAGEKKAWDGIVTRMSRSLHSQDDGHRTYGAQLGSSSPDHPARGRPAGHDDTAKGGARGIRD